eukprot:14835690-Ditylum_brightwellii.AAC.1
MNFWALYEVAPSKSKFLSGLSKDEKPSVSEQVESVLVHFLNENDLGYHKDNGGEENKRWKG